MSLFQVTKKQVTENYELRTMTGDIVSFTPSYSQLLPDPFSDLNVTVDIEATGGNGTPDNPNPIVGYSSANITNRTGVNIWDEVTEVGTIDSTTGENQPYAGELRTKNYTRCTPNTTYYNYKATGSNGQIYYYDLAKNYIGVAYLAKDSTFTTPNNAYYFRFRLGDAYGTTYHNDVSINSPSTDTTYHAYNGQTYAISFGQTVYGGVLDVTRGKLHVTWGKKIYDGSNDEKWTGFSESYDGAVIRDTDLFLNGDNPSLQIKADIAQVNDRRGSFTALSGVVIKVYGSVSDYNYFFLCGTGVTSVEEIRTWLSTHNLEIIYELATPFDIDLTPEVISAIVGTNNVFADCGQTTVTCLI